MTLVASLIYWLAHGTSKLARCWNLRVLTTDTRGDIFQLTTLPNCHWYRIKLRGRSTASSSLCNITFSRAASRPSSITLPLQLHKVSDITTMPTISLYNAEHALHTRSDDGQMDPRILGGRLIASAAVFPALPFGNCIHLTVKGWYLFAKYCCRVSDAEYNV